MALYKRIAVVPGDGIGPEVTAQALRVLEACSEVTGRSLETVRYDYSADTYLKTGVSIPPGGYDDFRACDAVFMGAFGDARVPDNKHAADILLGTRFVLDLYVNYRPCRLYDERLCPLKGIREREIDIAIFRENTEGLYVNIGGNLKKGTADEVAIQEEVNTRKGVQRIIEYAFEFAKQHRRKKVCMSDKSNVLRYGHDLWQRVFREIAGRYPEIEASHLYVDALCMEMVRDPRQFDVIVTNNMFGDIVTDLAAQLQGGLGMAASANINPGTTGMFEPVHGTAPKIAGKNLANPIGSVLTAQLMYEYLGMTEEASLVEKAVVRAIKENKTTKDLGGNLKTTEVGDFLCDAIKS